MLSGAGMLGAKGPSGGKGSKTKAFPSGPHRIVDGLVYGMERLADICRREAADLDEFYHDLLGHFQDRLVRYRLLPVRFLSC